MKLPLPNSQFSPARKGLYYGGIALALLGVVLFASTFLSYAMNFGKFDNFEENARSILTRAVAGMICLIIGGALTGIGARGYAGSGVLLDPERAKQDLEPWARMSGGLTDAAFSEMPNVRESIREIGSGGTREVIKVKCPACSALNDEQDKFCGQCGVKI